LERASQKWKSWQLVGGGGGNGLLLNRRVNRGEGLTNGKKGKVTG